MTRSTMARLVLRMRHAVWDGHSYSIDENPATARCTCGAVIS